MGLYLAIALLLVVTAAALLYLLTTKSEGPATIAGGAGGERGAAAEGGAAADKPRPGGAGAASGPSSPGPSPQGGGLVESEGDVSKPNPLILVNAVASTDPGLRRKHNEDSYLVLEGHDLFVVADGMGRQAAGEVASQLCVDVVKQTFEDGSFGVFPPGTESKEAGRLRAAALKANEAVFAKSSEVDAYHGMGTTMVALHFSRGRERAAILNAGDSRCYRFRGGRLEQLTTDHTLGAAGIVGGNAALLSKAVGIEENLDPEVKLDRPEPEDIYLLCSDGLSRMVPHEQLVETLGSGRDLDVIVRRLIEVANQAGGRDNVTVILVRVERAPLVAGR